MSHPSVLGDNIPVNSNNFVVAIMRKPDGKNPEHAFLMIEGETSSGQAILRRYDLLVDDKSPERKAMIYIRPEVVIDVSDAQAVLLGDILRGEEVYSVTWSITATQAEVLHTDILKDKDNPPFYQVSGNKALPAKSSGKEGHSCFTWAREKLHNLNDARVQLPEKYIDFIAAKTSSYIQGESEDSKKCRIM